MFYYSKYLYVDVLIFILYGYKKKISDAGFEKHKKLILAGLYAGISKLSGNGFTGSVL